MPRCLLWIRAIHCLNRIPVPGYRPLIARASGPLGTNAQYLFSLEQALRKLGMHDASLDDRGQRPCAVGRESDAGPA